MIIFEIVVFILVLSFLVVIHELGHFLAAKWAKIKVEEFGLGYPPRAVTLFHWLGTPFTLNWVPFGGFVKMEGEDQLDPSTTEKTTKDNGTNSSTKASKDINTNESAFYTKTIAQRLIVILAGVFVNFIFGILAFSIFFSFKGIPEYLDSARIAFVQPNSPAEVAGIPTDVEIVAITNQDGELFSVTNNAEAATALRQAAGTVVTIITTGPCNSGGCQELAQDFEAYVRTQDEIAGLENQGGLGVVFADVDFVFYPWYQMPFKSVWYGLLQTYGLVVLTLDALQTMIASIASGGSLPQDVAGPVGIVHQASKYEIFQQGPLVLLHFTGIISVSLAIMNLLPIPALDGGRAVFIVLELFLGKKKIEVVEQYAHYFGFVFLIGLILVITARDIWRIFI